MSEIKLKKVSQSSGLCGPASLSSLLFHYGIKKSERELAQVTGGTPEDGTEPEALLEGLRKLGFEAVARERGTWALLKRLVTHGTPVLVNWWSDYGEPADGHYSVVQKVTDKSIVMMDPEIGDYRRMSKERFMSHWYDYYRDGRKNVRWLLYVVI